MQRGRRSRRLHRRPGRQRARGRLPAQGGRDDHRHHRRSGEHLRAAVRGRVPAGLRPGPQPPRRDHLRGDRQGHPDRGGDRNPRPDQRLGQPPGEAAGRAHRCAGRGGSGRDVLHRFRRGAADAQPDDGELRRGVRHPLQHDHRSGDDDRCRVHGSRRDRVPDRIAQPERHHQPADEDPVAVGSEPGVDQGSDDSGVRQGHRRPHLDHAGSDVGSGSARPVVRRRHLRGRQGSGHLPVDLPRRDHAVGADRSEDVHPTRNVRGHADRHRR